MRGGIAEQLQPGAVIGIDTSVFIYAFERNPTYDHVVRPLLAALALGDLRGVTSIITLTELLVRPLRLRGTAAADSLQTRLLGHPNLEIRDVSRDIARRAAELRARHSLQPMDSLQVATAIQAGAAAFLTNDLRLQRVDDVPILLIDDFRP
jgi:predicted nucleic acid-binding protein